jgi:hypothetical protein
MNATPTPHDWSREAFLSKALRYSETMQACDRDDWQFGFWSSLLLEHLVRATLAGISPTLVAESKDWNNIYYALGYQPTTPKFRPHSAPTSALLDRVHSLVPEFTREMLGFCAEHTNRRNEELHSGACPYDVLGSSHWQPMFYASCDALLRAMGLTLNDIFGDDETETARTQILSIADTAALAVRGEVARFVTIWADKSEEEREELSLQAHTWASRTIGHRVRCPSCRSRAIVHGTPQGAPTKRIEEDMIVERQTMLPSIFLCVACGLRIAGFSKLNACGLGNTFTSTSRSDAAEYFSDGAEYGPEPDYNEDEF